MVSLGEACPKFTAVHLDESPIAGTATVFVASLAPVG